MNNSDFNDEWSVPGGASNPSNSLKESKSTYFAEQAYSDRTHDFIIALSQIFLGLAIVTISLLGFIQPLWLAAFTSVFAGIAILIGSCFLYIRLVNPRKSAKLVRRALARVMKFKN